MTPDELRQAGVRVNLDLARLKALADWLDHRGKPNSGIIYHRPRYDLTGQMGLPRVELHGADADFICNNFHGLGARKMHAELVALIARVERAEAALRAWRDWDLAEDASLELYERAEAEDWRNDPTGSMHLHSAVQRANDKRSAALALRDTALAALEAS